MILKNRPQVSIEQARSILREAYGLDGLLRPLPSERDQNFCLTEQNGRQLVLKIANRAESLSMVDAENAALACGASAGVCPNLIPDVHGAFVTKANGHLVRLITLLPGTPMGFLKQRSPALLTDLGRSLGLLSKALSGFDHVAAHRDFYWDLANAERVIAEHFDKVKDASIKEHISRLSGVYRDYASPLLAGFRQSVLHNDANDFNVIVDDTGERVSGIIDFGDMVFSHTVNEVAVAMAYAALRTLDPMAPMLSVLKAYNSEFPLLEPEVGTLFSLVAMRLSMSVCIAAQQQAERPDDAYLGISQQAIRDTLPRLAAIHPRLATYRFREACGFEPVPNSSNVVAWLQQQTEFASVLDGVDLRNDRIAEIDLSVSSPLVSGDPVENGPEPLAQRISSLLKATGAVIGAGGYEEARALYIAPSFSTTERLSETRSIHLGIDLTAAPGQRICAPTDGVVYGFEDASEPFDYGPVVVLRHESGAGHYFTLYGHLERKSLHQLHLGQGVRKGECFAALGVPAENGGWWPHLHFQLITDMLDVPANYNGTALPSERAVWKSLCPDPNVILRVPGLPASATRSDAELVQSRKARIGSNLSVSYGASPIQAVRGWMQYLYDATGRRYLDAYNNVPHVGHCHPRVVEAVARQLATLNTNTRYLQHQLTDYAEALVATFPEPLSVCFFTASGSEANELALRLARNYTRAKDLLVMDAAYHGHTNTLIDISPYKHDGPGGHGAPDWVHKTPIPDVYRGEFKATEPDAGRKYAAQVSAVIDQLRGAGRRLCGYIAETCPSVAGQILLPDGFLEAVYQAVRSANGICIADEVQTGFGRMGTHFWAFEKHGVLPDIVVLGKPIANGYPMGAVICRREIADSFDNGMEFFSTFGGSTAAVAAGMATLTVTQEENLQFRAMQLGERLARGLQDLKAEYPLIGDVRGSGLFAGVELVFDRQTLAPATRVADFLVRRMRERGVLLGTDGPLHNVVKIRGPLSMEMADIDALLETFGDVLGEIPAEPS